jgi:hypothetical protein
MYVYRCVGVENDDDKNGRRHYSFRVCRRRTAAALKQYNGYSL